MDGEMAAQRERPASGARAPTTQSVVIGVTAGELPEAAHTREEADA
jgi:hypothetical protein